MTALATIKGFEVMRMIRKRQCILLEPGVTDEVRFVAKLWSLRATVARHRESGNPQTINCKSAQPQYTLLIMSVQVQA
jgi:hypothetical protein